MVPNERALVRYWPIVNVQMVQAGSTAYGFNYSAIVDPCACAGQKPDLVLSRQV